MKALKSLLVLVALLLLGQSAQAVTVVITVGDNFYSPQTVTIQAGDSVRWQYATDAKNTHPTASDASAWTVFTINSANVKKALFFPTVGSFPYHCQFHGAPGVGMYGVITVSAALAVRPGALAEAFHVYPNPAADVVTLQLDRSPGQARGSVQLLDMLGKQVRTIDLGMEAAGQALTVSVADLPAGIYSYRLLAGREVVATRRLVVVR